MSDSAFPTPTQFLERVPFDLHVLAHELASLTRNWNVVEIVTASPESRTRERALFLDAYKKGEIYHPKFEYPHAHHLTVGDAEIILLELLKETRIYRPLSREAAFAIRALRCKIQDDLATVWLVRGIQQENDRLIGQALRSKYGGTDAPLIRAAKIDFQRRVEEARTGQKLETPTPFYTELREMEFDAKHVGEAFEWALNTYGMLSSKDGIGFDVRVDDSAAFIDVRDKSMLGPTVFIPEDECMTGDELIALIAHEIDGHARQTINGAVLLGVWNTILRVDDETYYEGLAMRYENQYKREHFGIDAKPSSLYAFAVRTAERGGSFHVIFDIQVRRQLRLALGIHRPDSVPVLEHLDPVLREHALDAAWNTTYRIMRGHIDTANPHHFAMPKDLAYLRGWLLDEALCSTDRSHLNECGIMTHRGMELLQDFGLTREHVPIPYGDTGTRYAKTELCVAQK